MRTVGWAKDVVAIGRALGYRGNAGGRSRICIFVYEVTAGAFALGFSIGAGVVESVAF